MLFYFSGTGNAFSAARALETGRGLQSITAAWQEQEFSYTPAPAEPVGFVFPVVFGGVPDLVLRFLRRLQLSTQPDYLYVVKVGDYTHFPQSDFVADQLRDSGFSPDAIFSLDMPGNCVLLYEILPAEQEDVVLAAAKTQLQSIRQQIEQRAHISVAATLGEREQAFLQRLYERERSTEHFHVLDTCIGCATCAGRCPEEAIEMRLGVPVWTKEKCSLCMACMRCGAIIHGLSSKGRKRYTHPDLRKQKCH